MGVGACPLHARTISLIEQITHKYDCVYMDNMYLLAKLCLLTWKYTEGQIHGVCRQGGRGIPSNMKQEAESKQDREFKARNTLMVSVCKGDPDMTDIVCTSLYDTKPFYMMSTFANQVTWTKKFMNVFCDNSL